MEGKACSKAQRGKHGSGVGRTCSVRQGWRKWRWLQSAAAREGGQWLRGLGFVLQVVITIQAFKKGKWHLPNFIKFPLKVPWKMEATEERLEGTLVRAISLEFEEEKIPEQLLIFSSRILVNFLQGWSSLGFLFLFFFPPHNSTLGFVY